MLYTVCFLHLMVLFLYFSLALLGISISRLIYMRARQSHIEKIIHSTEFAVQEEEATCINRQKTTSPFRELELCAIT